MSPHLASCSGSHLALDLKRIFRSNLDIVPKGILVKDSEPGQTLVTGPVVRYVPPVLLADLFRRSTRIRLSICDGVVRMFVNRATLAHTSHAGKNGFNSSRSWVPVMAFHAYGETLDPWDSGSV